ncbi:MAG: pentapeptide repeat-containing protein [Candidatus Hodarchaeota archaeon]
MQKKNDSQNNNNLENLQGEIEQYIERIKHDQLFERVKKNEEEIRELKKKIGEKSKDTWDKAKIFGSVVSGVILAVVAIFGSIFIPKSINRQSLESVQLRELSNLIPNLYIDSLGTRSSSIIAMSSYGSSAVPILLMSLESAIKQEHEDLAEAIRTSIGYIGEDAKKTIIAKLAFEISILSELSASTHKPHYIGELISILIDLGIEKISFLEKILGMKNDLIDILREYFTKANKFKENKTMLNELNAIALQAVSKSHYPVSKLTLSNLNFDHQNLEGISFENANLVGSSFFDCNLVSCNFRNAYLDSCIFTDAMFFYGDFDHNRIIEILKGFLKVKWETEPFIDLEIQDVINELKKKNPDKGKIIEQIELLKSK